MQILLRARSLLEDERVRRGLGFGVAFLWFGIIMAVEPWVPAVFKLCFAAPAVLVFVWWRSRPWVGLALSLVALVVVLFGGSNGVFVSGAALTALSTGWLAVLGASMNDDQRVRWGGAGLIGLESLLALGNSGFFGFIAVLFFGGLAIGGGHLWRRRGTERALHSRIVDADQRSEAAEQDVLVELERNRLARDVHDVVAHSLAVVIAQADGARFAAEEKPETVVPALEAISDTARRALGEVRTMLHDLRTSGEGGVVPGASDLDGLVAGVRGLGVEVEQVAWGEPQGLERASGLALYRVAQEALTNAMRHGDRAEPVGFELDWGEREVVLVVTNAVPPDVLPATERAGHGVTGMRERAADAGGDCSAGIGSNGRYRVRVALPIAPPRVEAAAAPPPANPLLALLMPDAHERAHG